MSADTNINMRVSLWQRIGLIGLMTIFVIMGTLRLNDCDLFNPDSPRYVIYSKAILDLGEYRATDVPDTPLYSWRPPGLSLLLTPAMAMWPYDVIAAKSVILLTGALLLWMVFDLASLHSGGWAALIVTAVVASNPSFYIMSTEVLTEIPYTLGVVVVLLILSRSTMLQQLVNGMKNPWSWKLTMGVGVVALTLTPWLRTAGIALVAAVGIWTLMCRPRFQWIPGFAVAVAAFGLLAWRNTQVGGENYVGSLLSRFREQGVGPVIASGFETICYYLCALPSLLLPGTLAERTWYSPLTIDGLPTIGLPFVFVACAAAVIVSFSLIGMCQRRAHGGSLTLLYLLIYCACLVVWPWRHERFLWPLIPVLMSYVPTGASALSACFPVVGYSATFLGTTSMVALVCWQSIGCQHIAEVNQEFVKDRDAFHANRIPGFYFSNWRRAGEWLNAHTPPSSRVLTWNAAVGGTSHRFQKRVLFETLSPEKVRQQIEGFSARYLVVPAAQFGDGFGWQQMSSDPAICLNEVYREHDVAVLEVTPNRTGTISKDAYPQWLEKQLLLVSDARNKQPQRVDLAIRQAALLRESGKSEEAIHLLRKLLDDGVKTVRVCSELGWLLYDRDEFAEAVTFLDMARQLPNAESIAKSLSDSVAMAKERMKDALAPNAEPAFERRLSRVKSLMSLLRYDAAERELALIADAFPKRPEVDFLSGKLFLRIGEDAKAEACFENALNAGLVEAQQLLLQIRFIKALASEHTTIVVAGTQQESVEPSDPAMHLRAAEYQAKLGWTGRALATLEKAIARFPQDPSIQFQLADMYQRFARPELAVPLYQSVLDTHPSHELARKGLETAQRGLLEPEMFPRGNEPGGELYARRRQ